MSNNIQSFRQRSVGRISFPTRPQKTTTQRKQRTYIISYDSSSGEDTPKGEILEHNLQEQNIKIIKGKRYTSEVEFSKNENSKNNIGETFYKTTMNYTPQKQYSNINDGVYFKENYTPQVDITKMRVFANKNRNYANFYFPLRDLNIIEKRIIQDAPINWLLGKPDEIYYNQRMKRSYFPKFQYQYQPGVKVNKKYNYYISPENKYIREEYKRNNYYYGRPGRFPNENIEDKAATLISSAYRGYRTREEFRDYLDQFYETNRREFENPSYNNAYYSLPNRNNYPYVERNYYDESSDDYIRSSYNRNYKYNDKDIHNIERNYIQNNKEKYNNKIYISSDEIEDNFKNISPTQKVENIPKEKKYINVIKNERVDNNGNVVKETTTKTIISNLNNNKNISNDDEDYYEEETKEIITNKKPVNKVEKSSYRTVNQNKEKEIVETDDIEITINEEQFENKRKIGHSLRTVNKINNNKKNAAIKLTHALENKVKKEENILLDNLNQNRKEKRIEDAMNKVSNYIRKTSSKEIFNKINENNKEENRKPIITKNVVQTKKIVVKKNFNQKNENANSTKKEDKSIKNVIKHEDDNLKGDLDIARKQTLSNLIAKKVTREHAINDEDDDDDDYEKEIAEMENIAKISKFFDKATERLKYYFNVFRRKTENYIEDIEEEIIDESENDKINGLNKLKNIIDNKNKNKAMNALKQKKEDEIKKEKLSDINKIISNKEKEKGMNALKQNQNEQLKKEKLMNITKTITEKEKKTVMTTLKNNKEDKIKKEKLNNLNKVLLEKEKQKGMNALKRNKEDEEKIEKLNNLNKIISNKEKEIGMEALKKNKENEIKLEKLNSLDKIISDKEKEIGLKALKRNKEDEEKKEKLNNLNKVLSDKEKEKGLNALKQNKENELKKEKLNNLNKVLTDKEKEKGLNALKQKKEDELKKEKLNKLEKLLSEKEKQDVIKKLKTHKGKKMNNKDENILNIARKQTLTHLLIRKQTIQQAINDNDEDNNEDYDYDDYEKEFIEMENNAKISKFFDKATERLKYYFNVFRRKTENYVENIEEEIIDESEKDKINGLNKLKNVIDNKNKNKAMNALKQNQKDEKITETFNKLENITSEKLRTTGIKKLKQNKDIELKKEKLNKLENILSQKSKTQALNSLKQNKKDKEIKEQLTKLNSIILEKEKNKGMTALKQKQNEEKIKEQIIKLNEIIEQKQKDDALNSLKKNQEDEKMKEHLIKISYLITEKEKNKVMTALKQKQHDEKVKEQLQKLNELMEKKEKEMAFENLSEYQMISYEEYFKKMKGFLFIKVIAHVGYHYLHRKLLYFLKKWIKNAGIKIEETLNH